MSAAPDYHSCLDEAYQGEIYGVVLYERIAAAQPDPEKREKWQVLIELEKTTKAVLEPVLIRHGLSTEGRDESVSSALRDVSLYVDLSWQALMQRFSDELDDDILEYEALQRQAPPEDLAAINFLLDHEYVTKTFCDREIQGRYEDSIQPVKDLIASRP